MSSTPTPSEAVRSTVDAMHNRLDELQFGKQSVDDAKFVVLDQDGYGFGAQFERRMLGLQLALMYSRTAVFVHESLGPYARCFQPTSSFSYADIEHLPREHLDYTPDQPAKVAFFDFDGFWKDPSINRPIYDWIPDDFKALELDRMGGANKHAMDLGFKALGPAKRLFEGHLLSRFKYLPQYAQGIEAVKERIGFRSPIIGVHIRRGDKACEAPYVPLRRYHAEIRRAVKESGITRVFVSSDDPGVYAHLPDKGRIQYIYDNEETRFNNANHRMIAEKPELKQQETLTALKIYDLLSHCDVIVGQNNAHLTLLAVSRNEARNMGEGDYRLIPGDYITQFRYAQLGDWGEVARFKFRRFCKGNKTELIRRMLRPIKRVVRGF